MLIILNNSHLSSVFLSYALGHVLTTNVFLKRAKKLEVVESSNLVKTRAIGLEILRCRDQWSQSQMIF